MAQLANPFRPAEQVEPRVKALVFGGPGAGKTYLALGSPGRVAVIDTEGGTAFYAGRKGLSDFDVLPTKTYAEVKAAVEYLATPEGRAAYATVVIDPVTIIYETLQASALLRRAEMNRRRGRGSSDPDEADLEQLDWGRIKRSYKSLMTALVNLPQHVVVTAREKAETVRDPQSGEFNTTGRYLPDAEKGTAYYFDVVLRLVDEGGTRTAVIVKDRTAEAAPINAKVADPTFTSLFADVLKRKGKAQRHVPDDSAAAAADAAAEEDAQRATPTAIAEMVELLERSGKDPAALLTALRRTSWDQVSAINVAKLTAKAREALAASATNDDTAAAAEATPAQPRQPTRNGRSRTAATPAATEA